MHLYTDGYEKLGLLLSFVLSRNGHFVFFFKSFIKGLIIIIIKSGFKIVIFWQRLFSILNPISLFLSLSVPLKWTTCGNGISLK